MMERFFFFRGIMEHFISRGRMENTRAPTQSIDEFRKCRGIRWHGVVNIKQSLPVFTKKEVREV